MASQPRLVNKQFNSPIGLYSQQNIQDVLDRDLQILSNGGVGINFYNPVVGKPANLQNSAVLRMLEEESRYQNGSMRREGDIDLSSKPKRRQPKWPPYENERKRRFKSAFKDVVISGTKRVAWPPIENLDENGVQRQVHQTSSSPARNSHPPEPQVAPAGGISRPPLQPLNISCNNPPSLQSPRSPVPQHSPKGYGESPAPKGWAPVHSPVSPRGYSPSLQQNYSPGFQQYSDIEKTQPYSPSSTQQSFSPSAQHYNPPQRSATPCHIPNKVLEPPPAVITLRPQAPVSQPSPPVYSSQPATATLKGGKYLRGDMKWPPENVKKQAEEENRLRLELAKGPVFRPRKVNKDYTNFFAQHALNSSYPGYRAPPGTQYYAASDY